MPRHDYQIPLNTNKIRDPWNVASAIRGRRAHHRKVACTQAFCTNRTHIPPHKGKSRQVRLWRNRFRTRIGRLHSAPLPRFPLDKGGLGRDHGLDRLDGQVRIARRYRMDDSRHRYPDHSSLEDRRRGILLVYFSVRLLSLVPHPALIYDSIPCTFTLLMNWTISFSFLGFVIV